MKNWTLISTIVAASLLSPLVLAQSGITVTQAPTTARMQANHLSTNTVRAIFKGVREQRCESLVGLLAPPSEPQTPQKLALFEVVEAMAFQSKSPLSVTRMRKGQLFSVALDGDLVGQSPDVLPIVEKLKEGDEVVVLVEELMTNSARLGQDVVYAASRMAQRGAPELQAVESVEDAAEPAPVAVGAAGAQSQMGPNPIPMARGSLGGRSQLHQQSSFVQITNRNGKMQKTEVQQSTDPATGELVTRMFIDGVEVDPQTKKPLKATDASSDQKKKNEVLKEPSVQPAEQQEDVAPLEDSF